MEDQFQSNLEEQPLSLQEIKVQDSPEAELPEMTISKSAVKLLKETAPWMKFFGILGFIASAFLLIVALAMLFGIGNFFKTSTLGIGVLLFMIYCGLSVIIFYPSLFLYNCAESMGEFSVTNDKATFEKALLMQKKYWVYMGILTIIYISLIIVLMLFRGLQG
jgi:hypothetical protein